MRSRHRPVAGLAVRDALRGWDALDFEVANSRALVAVFGATEATGRAAERLVDALAAVPVHEATAAEQALAPHPPWPVSCLSPRAAYLSAHEVVDAEHAVGRVSADTLAAYPPGIPNLMPGEIITADIVAFLRDRARRGAFVRGSIDADVGRLRVVA